MQRRAKQCKSGINKFPFDKVCPLMWGWTLIFLIKFIVRIPLNSVSTELVKNIQYQSL